MEPFSGSTLAPRRGSPFLRLPLNVRRRIYFQAGLAPLERRGLPRILDLHGDFDRSTLGFYGLLLSCKAIYYEASALLYSLNSFVIRMPPRNECSHHVQYLPQRTGLAPLRQLTASSLASLRQLKIILSEASCHPPKHNTAHGHCCDYINPQLDVPQYTCKWHETVTHGEPLLAADSFTTRTLAEWQSTVKLLSSRGVDFSNLTLAFVCDIRRDEPQLAQLAVSPLSLLAPLKDCHVRLCREHSNAIQEIANDAVLSARGIPQQPAAPTGFHPLGVSGSVSRLLSLPRELRFRILEYTDLITPCREVTWDRSLACFLIRRPACVNIDGRGRTCNPRVHHGCQFFRCWLTYPAPSIGCFCGLTHSASSSTCRCWGSPLALFLVCRALYHDSQVVFFSGNRFVVHDFNSMSPWRHPPLPRSPSSGYPSQRLAISIFLRDIVPSSCLGLLRFVEMVFPPYPHDGWPKDGDPAVEDWINCIEWARHNLNVPALTLRLYMADTSDLVPQEDREQLSKEEGREILSAYMRISGPLSKLGGGGLASFYAHFVWPWTWTPEVQAKLFAQSEDGARWLAQKEAVLKERAERWVMGKRYDTLYLNREEPPESIWKVFFARDC